MGGTGGHEVSVRRTGGHEVSVRRTGGHEVRVWEGQEDMR